MDGRQARRGAISGLVALVLFALQLRVASGVQIQRHNESIIPVTVWVTGQWASNAPEIEQVGRNMRVKTETKQGQTMAEMAFARWVPIGARIRYFTDTDMVESAREISQELREEGVTEDAFAAFSNLRPPAYRADLWRYMVLWAYGGVYLDANIKLTAPIETWVDFQSQKIVLVYDKYAPSCAYWNAMMASPAKNEYLATLIRFVVNNIENHAYGHDWLDITGPTAMCKALNSMGPIQAFWFRIRSLTCNMVKDGLHARVLLNQGWGRMLPVAEKDESLHDEKSKSHYGTMWREGAVFCDQLNDTMKNDTSTMCGAEGFEGVEARNVTEALQGAEADEDTGPKA